MGRRRYAGTASGVSSLKVTTVGHVTIYRYRPKASQSTVRALLGLWPYATLEYSARRSSVLLMPDKS